MTVVNPRKWRYTWEAQSHLPILKLFLFNPELSPISHCNHLNVELKFEKSLLHLTWIESISSDKILLLVPLPRVLVDLESQVNFRVLDDHIEVKITLLLPVEHPIVSSFISELNSGDEIASCSTPGHLEPLSMDSDYNSLSSKGEVDFYCRNCSFKLTRASIRCLVDLPSVNWTEVADNWFDACCCSFGGISEKMVVKYVKSYKCTLGTCLLTTASVILCKDDVSGLKFPDSLTTKCEDDVLVNNSTERTTAYDSVNLNSVQDQAQNDSVNGIHTEPDDHSKHNLCHTLSASDASRDAISEHHCCKHDAESSQKDPIVSAPVDFQDDQKSFLNSYLGNAFLFKSSGLSKDIEWVRFACPQCSCVLGAFPCDDDSESLDGGIRLLKYCISTSPPSDILGDLFRKYTLERMFTCQLLESANDELSFRTVVKDLKTQSPMLHIVLVNPNSWCYSGYCCENATTELLVKINLQPVAKVLFSQSELSTQEWEMKNQDDEIYMLADVGTEVIKSLERARDMFPPSFSSSQVLLLSSIPR